MTAVEILGEGRFLCLEREGRWEYTRRVGCHGAVAIIAVTDADELILVEQHRLAVHAQVIELPAGLVGDEQDPNESVQHAALREIEEEAGFRARHAKLLFTIPSCAGMSAEMVSIVRLTGLTQIGAGGGVGHEQIVPRLVPLASLHTWLAAQQQAGLWIDPKVYLAGYWLHHSK